MWNSHCPACVSVEWSHRRECKISVKWKPFYVERVCCHPNRSAGWETLRAATMPLRPDRRSRPAALEGHNRYTWTSRIYRLVRVSHRIHLAVAADGEGADEIASRAVAVLLMEAEVLVSSILRALDNAPLLG